MKRLRLFVPVLALVAMFGCDKSNSTQPEPTPTPTSASVRGIISTNTTLTKDKVWTLRGYVYVTSGATLTIEPGTKIISKKDSAGVLVITKGCKINAKGTAAEPIVFTSGESFQAPGDLGGVVIAGLAKGNGNHAVMEGGLNPQYANYGGSDDADNSGVLSYVRIEYAGKAVNPNDEVNGLSMYAVGSGTQVDHIQVIRGLDDAFEFFGGTFNAKYLVAYNSADDDFDFDDGYRGNLQYLISFRDPSFTDAKPTGDLSNNIECDNTNGAIPYTTTPITHVRISNATFIGPNNTVTGVTPNYGYGFRWRRGSQFEMVNCIQLGSKKAAFSIESNETAQAFNDGVSIFKNSIINVAPASPAVSPVNIGADVNAVVGFDATKMLSLASGVSVITNAADVKLTDPFNVAKPNLMPLTGSPALTSSPDFTGNFAANGFEKTNFIGAMGTTDWTTGWTVWGK